MNITTTTKNNFTAIFLSIDNYRIFHLKKLLAVIYISQIIYAKNLIGEQCTENNKCVKKQIFREQLNNLNYFI
jgi:hypothetical protein